MTVPAELGISAGISARISGGTKILGLIADPVVQARSPAMATALLRERGCFGDFVLLPMQVKADGLAVAVAGLRSIENFAGAIVSMPHKTAIVPLLDELEAEAELVGAVNVIARSEDGRLRGTVLDGEGFVAGLLGAGHRVEGQRCLLAGAGGAASAIAFALAHHGCRSLVLLNRTASKASSLASRVSRAFPAVEVVTDAAGPGRFDVAINGTCLGMKPDDELPLSLDILQRSALVAECVLAPERTRLLETAEAAGCAVHGGVAMLAAQMDLMLRFMGVPGVPASGGAGA